MRSADVTQSAMLSYRILEERIPRAHPPIKLRALVDGILVTLHAEFEALYAGSGRPSIPPERFLRASLIQTLPTIRSERQLADRRPEPRKGAKETAEIRFPSPAMAWPDPVGRHQWAVAEGIRRNFNILLIKNRKKRTVTS